MNVQFSITANTSPQNNIDSNHNEASMPVRSSKDLDLKEKQGISVSVGEEQLIRTIDRAVKSLQGPETTLDISIHDKTHEIMVKVVNKDTGEIIREVPPEKTLDLVARMMELAGIMIDAKV